MVKSRKFLIDSFNKINSEFQIEHFQYVSCLKKKKKDCKKIILKFAKNSLDFHINSTMKKRKNPRNTDFEDLKFLSAFNTAKSFELFSN